MTKHPPLPETPVGGNHASRVEPAYAIGYRRPPLHTRFKPGQSGNRNGRPRRHRNVRTVVEEALNQKVKIRVGDQIRSLTKLEAVVLTIVTGAIKADPKAQASLLALLRSVGMTGEAPEVPKLAPVTADDAALIADYLRRHGLELQPTDRPEGDPTPAGTTPPDTETNS